MDIQAEKIELIKLITDVESESVLKKIKSILQPKEKVESPAMIKRLEESRRQYEEGKAVSILLSDLAGMSSQSFNDIWDNKQDERWDIYLQDKIAHV